MMRVLVLGASGYVGNRVVAAILEHGGEVVAGARDPLSLDQVWWSDRVERVKVDMSDESSVRAAVTSDVDAVVYLVHGMGDSDFSQKDADAARYLRDAVNSAGVKRVVYLSGIIPQVPEEELSEHLRSRLQVERILSESTARVITLRAAMIIGSGSTSFELMRQLGSRLPVTIVPEWMVNDVEPIAIVDVVRAILGALEAQVESGHYDIGGGEVISYPDLISLVGQLSGEERPSISVPLLPTALVSQVATFIADIPAPTIKALMESLHEPMVSGEHRWISDLCASQKDAQVNLRQSIERSLTVVDPLVPPSKRDPMGPMPGDPEWAETPQS
ncbi:NAD(P)H-binding protein [Neomicrococcus lactis]|uniref:Uncharacterized protein YbjT (DUF2867 family) n=1 Tax=Neomicrococcus lactis TaxID=732241 RepID=A0A7W9DC31_9MICC|nr:NAD(P)H-binding protein [Neomicrococcus lactis]MBB5599343.1 uncharacterized protein YbjT (DUF2867 family) [Neomicrococcus lactis]